MGRACPRTSWSACSSASSRLPRTTAGEIEGSGHGLGLAISRGIARLQGGDIRATNRSDRSGLVMTVDLPA